MTRRAFLWASTLVGTLSFVRAVFARPAVAAPLAIDRLREPLAAAPPSREAAYRADAAFLFIGMNFYTRPAAGGGWAAMRERLDGDRRTLELCFRAGSYPDNARGLNRLGLFEEVVVERGRQAQEAAYFGFLTSSEEDSLDAGLKSIEDEAKKEKTFYKAIDGHIRGGREKSRRVDFLLPSKLDWSRIDDLETLVRDGLKAPPNLLESEQAAEPAPFLYSVMRAAWDSAEETDVEYCYNGHRYRLEAKRKLDEKESGKLAEAGVVAAGTRLARLEGKITGITEKAKTHFRLWVEDGRPGALPVKFDYKARGFLRVSFERVEV